MVLSDVRYAVRRIARTPVASLAAIAVLALGIAANTTMFGVLHAVLLRPLPYPAPDRLVRIWEQQPRRDIARDRAAPQNVADWRDQNHSFDSIGYWAAFRGANEFNLVGPQGSERVRGAYASASLFRVLGVGPRLGRTLYAQDDEMERNPVVVLSDRLWQRRFRGDPEIVGKTLTVDSYARIDYTIVGVMPPGLDYPNDSEMWLPAGFMGLRDVDLKRRDVPWFSVLARMRPGMTVEQAQADVQALQQRIAADAKDPDISPSVVLQLLQDESMGTVKPALFLLQGTVLFVLLIACANVANLLLANAAARHREIAVRAAMGAGRARVFWQLLVESVVRALAAGALGVLLAMWGMSLVRRFGPDTIPRLAGTELNGPVLLFTLGVSLLAAVLFGLAPALHLVRGELTDHLREGSRGSTTGVGHTRIRNGLLVAEVALTLILLVGAGLLLQSLYKLQRIDMGFTPEQLLTAKLDMSSSTYSPSGRPGPNRPQDFTKRVLERLDAMPGVRAAAADLLPPAGSIMRTVAIQGRAVQSKADMPSVLVRAVTSNYFDVMDVPLKKGRAFTDNDTEAMPSVVIINDAFARRHFANVDPLGQRLDLQAGTRRPDDTRPIVFSEIVGIVGDVRNTGANEEPKPEVYAPYYQWAWNQATLVMRTATTPSSLGSALRIEVHRMNPDQPIPNVQSMGQILGTLHAEPRFRTLLVGLFGAIALILATIGIYGVLDYGVTQRTHEIGVRLALGASSETVRRMVVRQALRLVAIGVVIGLIGAALLSRLMSTLLFNVSPLDPPTFVGAAVFLIGLAWLAVFYPARRAASLDPMLALRHE